MYDDLSSLTEKLKLSGVSFQTMKDDKEGDTPVTVSEPLTGEIITVNGSTPANDLISVNVAKGENSAGKIVQMASQSQPQRRKDAQPVERSHKISTPFTSVESGVRDNIAAMQRASHRQAVENNPVKLDMLFASIGNKNI